jgi:tellurite resistance protein
MAFHLKVPVVPASFFGMVLGLSGLANAWRAAHQVWGLPAWIGEALVSLSTTVWMILIILYGAKLLVAREDALTELGHAVQCCFVGLIGVTTMLVAGGVLPYAQVAADVLFAVGMAATVLFAVWRTGGLWQGEREHTATTPVLYLPTVAGSFVTATVAAAFGYADWGQLAFGAGLFSWLAIESVLLHRLLTVSSLPEALRPTLGIQLAPAPVGAVAYLVGYALLQAIVLVRLLSWISREAFAPSYWAFTFGATALATAPLRLIARGDAGAVAYLAPVLFVAANLVVGAIAVGTVWLLLRGQLVKWLAGVPAQALDVSKPI